MTDTDVKKDDEKAKEVTKLEDQQFTTQHSLTIGGERFDYTARVGRLVLHDDSEESKAKVAIFYTAYTRNDVASLRDRPLIYIWNGGPGSAAVWLHLYALGPRRITFDNDPLLDTARWELKDNDQSLLDVADLVFIDPPNTGFSRVVPGEDPEQFRGVDEDAAIVGDFVVKWTDLEGRGDSPLVILGESYGTIRAPAVADYLQTRRGLFLDGVVLVSSVMDLAGVTFGPLAALGPVGQLPTYAATALFHGHTSGDLETVVAEAEAFALDDYTSALLKGSRLDVGERSRIAGRLSELTGLSREFIEHSNLRVSLWRFMKELLRDQRRTVGRLDTRWVGIDSDSAGEAFEDDPSLSTAFGPAVRAMEKYLREELGWEGDTTLRYRFLQGFSSWKTRKAVDMGIWTPQLEVATLMKNSINRAPHMKVLLQSGYYDVATPYFAAELSFDQMLLEPERAANVTMQRYEAGHMMYLHEPSLEKMRVDLVDWLGTVRAPQ